MERILVIDGHSVIHATDWLLQIHNNHPESGREALVRELSEFQNMTAYHVVLVYDGKGHHRGKQGGSEKDILVMYSRSNETADKVIERIAVQQSVKHDVQVVSNDRMVLDSCSASGAFVMSVTNMWEKIDGEVSSLKRSFKKG